MRNCLFAVLILAAVGCGALEIKVTDEYRRIDSFGNVIQADGASRVLVKGKTITLSGAAGGYVSFNLGIMPGAADSTRVSMSFDAEGVAADLFRAWFHKDEKSGVFYPGACIPLKAGEALKCPAPDNKVEKQTCVAVWVDVWIPAAYVDRTVNGALTVTAGDVTETYKLKIKTAPNPIPAEDGLEADHNTYGVGWVFKLVPQYAKTIEGFRESDAYNNVLHDVYRLMYEHRGRVHNLGYNHNGYVQAIFAPQLAGEGADKCIVSWKYFDRRFGPLLDGSAFKNTRRGPYPIPGIYLTINPEWPASMAHWGEDAYETAFVNTVGSMEKHFRAKGWVNTRFEMFFNHKKRYKAFSWDGDETKFTKDNPYFFYYGKLLRKAVPADSPVRFVFRHDASWQLKNQVDELKGVVDHWILSGGCSSLYPEVFPELQERGDVIWVYGGPSSMFVPSSGILKLAAQAWMKGAHGFEHWLFTNPGGDPWFKCDGARTGLVFSGEAFGIRGPIPCIRLKIQRNFLQDVALARALYGKEAAGKAAALAGLTPADWFVASRPPLVDRDPKTWNNPDIGEAAKVKVSDAHITGDWALEHRDVLLAERKRALKPVASALRDATPVKEEPLPPYTAPEKKRPSTDACIKAMAALAAAAREEISGTDAAKIMTEWGAEKMFKIDPRDRWAGGDNFDVHHKRYDAMKKKLIHLSRRLPFRADCNLWVVCRYDKGKVQLVIRQLNGFTPDYTWGQLYRDPTEKMNECLKGNVVRADNRDFVAFFAPVTNDTGHVTGFVQIATRKREIE